MNVDSFTELPAGGDVISVASEHHGGLNRRPGSHRLINVGNPNRRPVTVGHNLSIRRTVGAAADEMEAPVGGRSRRREAVPPVQQTVNHTFVGSSGQIGRARGVAQAVKDAGCLRKVWGAFTIKVGHELHPVGVGWGAQRSVREFG